MYFLSFSSLKTSSAENLWIDYWKSYYTLPSTEAVEFDPADDLWMEENAEAAEQIADADFDIWEWSEVVC